MLDCSLHPSICFVAILIFKHRVQVLVLSLLRDQRKSDFAGYIRGGDAAFMGLDKKTGWRGGRRYLRELGHGLYLMWMLLNFTFVWAVGVSRFTDNKHNISDILGGWLLGFAFALIYATRSTCLHKYVVMHNVQEIDTLSRPQEIRTTADGRVMAPADPADMTTLT